MNKPTQVIVAIHWDGSSWHTLALPKLTPVGGKPWVPDGIAALSADQVWVEETVAVNPGTGAPPPGITLLHWNGTAWAVADRDLKHIYSPGLTPDGRGGLWLTSNSFIRPVNDIRALTGLPSQLALAKAGGWCADTAFARRGARGLTASIGFVTAVKTRKAVT